MSADKKHFLMINSRPPHRSTLAQEALDVVLACSVFEQPLAVLFVGDGVFQLKGGQQPAAIARKNFASTFAALEIYDIRDIYVDAAALRARQLRSEDLCIPVTPVEGEALAALIDRQDIIFNF